MQTVTIIDYGLGNILSVINAFKYLDIETKLAKQPSEVIDAQRIVIPGVGAFPEGMKRLKSLGLEKIILKKASENTPILGICLGMQMLFTKSYEFKECDGLNLISGKVVKLIQKKIEQKRLPMIGWKKTFCNQENNFSKTLKETINKKTFYYLHSYSALPDKKDCILAYYDREGEFVISAVAKGKIWGVQFHPEKSGNSGLDFLKIFSKQK